MSFVTDADAEREGFNVKWKLILSGRVKHQHHIAAGLKWKLIDYEITTVSKSFKARIPLKVGFHTDDFCELKKGREINPCTKALKESTHFSIAFSWIVTNTCSKYWQVVEDIEESWRTGGILLLICAILNVDINHSLSHKKNLLRKLLHEVSRN